MSRKTKFWKRSLTVTTVALLSLQVTLWQGSAAAENAVPVEIVSMREEGVKYFDKGNGHYTAALYGTPVHYQENGEWKEIDNTLQTVQLSGNLPAAAPQAMAAQQTGNTVSYLKNTANDFDVWLPSAISGDAPFMISYKGHTLRFSMTNTAVRTAAVAPAEEEAPASADDAELDALTQVTTGASATYENVRGNTDLVCNLHAKRLEEKLVLSQPTDGGTYQYRLYYTGLTAILREDNAVVFTDTETEEEIFCLISPYMVDAQDDFSGAVDVALTPTADGCIYAVTPEAEWLQDDARAYPVTLSTSYQATTARDANSIADTTVHSGSPNANFYTLDRLYVGSYVSGGNAYEHRTFIRFTMPSAVSSSDVIENAYMYMTYYPSYQSGDNNTYRAYAANWNFDSSTLTWNTQASPAYGTAAPGSVVARTTDSSSTVHAYNVTNLVTNWITYGYANYGIVIKPTSVDTQKTNRTCYVSSDSGSTNKRPYVTINYHHA